MPQEELNKVASGENRNTKAMGGYKDLIAWQGGLSEIPGYRSGIGQRNRNAVDCRVSSEDGWH
jgi:hypothetical protein